MKYLCLALIIAVAIIIAIIIAIVAALATFIAAIAVGLVGLVACVPFIILTLAIVVLVWAADKF